VGASEASPSYRRARRRIDYEPAAQPYRRKPPSTSAAPTPGPSLAGRGGEPHLASRHPRLVRCLSGSDKALFSCGSRRTGKAPYPPVLIGHRTAKPCKPGASTHRIVRRQRIDRIGMGARRLADHEPRRAGRRSVPAGGSRSHPSPYNGRADRGRHSARLRRAPPSVAARRSAFAARLRPARGRAAQKHSVSR
jgi:hypothetical protein